MRADAEQLNNKVGLDDKRKSVKELAAMFNDMSRDQSNDLSLPRGSTFRGAQLDVSDP